MLLSKNFPGMASVHPPSRWPAALRVLALLPRTRYEPHRQVLRPVHDYGAEHDRRAVEFNPLGIAQQLLIDKPQLGPAQRATEAEVLAGTQC